MFTLCPLLVEDKLRTEIEVALAAECNIVPVVDNFQFPAQEELSPAVRAVSYFNCVRWVHDYQDACLDKERLTIGARVREEVKRKLKCKNDKRYYEQFFHNIFRIF